MLGIGPLEMIVIGAIALIVIGPEKFPDFAKMGLKTFRELRGHFDEMKTELNKELKPVKKEIDDLKDHNPEDYIDSLSKPVVGALSDEEIYKQEHAEENSDGQFDDTTGEELGAQAFKEDTVSNEEEEIINPEPDDGAWEREEYKIAGQEELDDDLDIDAPDRLD